MSTPLRPMASTSNGCVVVKSPSGGWWWLAYDCALRHSGLSIVCPDILTFDRAVLVFGYLDLIEPRSETTCPWRWSSTGPVLSLSTINFTRPREPGYAT